TFSAVESRIVLGVPDAYELPQAPGHGYLKIDTTTMLRFRAAYVSGPYRARGVSGAPAEAVVQRRVVRYGVDHVPVPALPAEPVVAEAPEAGKQVSMLDVMAGRLRGQGRPAHQVWLPPLDEPPSLDELLPPLAVDERVGLQAQWPGRGRLAAPVGVVDRPFEQRRDPLLVELDGAGGNVVVVGGPQSGKSTLLRSMLCALALTHTPWAAQFLCLY